MAKLCSEQMKLLHRVQVSGQCDDRGFFTVQLTVGISQRGIASVIIKIDRWSPISLLKTGNTMRTVLNVWRH